MTPHRQIGQSLIASFEGSVHSARTQTLLQDYAVGNFLLNTQNLHGIDHCGPLTRLDMLTGRLDEPQVLGLVLALQESARSLQHPAPLLVGIEQEGGLVRMPSHMRNSFKALVSQT